MATTAQPQTGAKPAASLSNEEILRYSSTSPISSARLRLAPATSASRRAKPRARALLTLIQTFRSSRSRRN